MQANMGASGTLPRESGEFQGTILLVEDSPTQAARFSKLLTQEGLEVFRAESAEVGLKMLETHRPNVIVLDNHLPNMTGNEFCREIRLNVNTRAIPVLMLTVEESNIAEMQGLASGADDYVLKTVDPDIFIARIRALVRNSDTDPTVPEVESNFEIIHLTKCVEVLYASTEAALQKTLPCSTATSERASHDYRFGNASWQRSCNCR
jgi:DNA-binding response OmpR family regulator